MVHVIVAPDPDGAPDETPLIVGAVVSLEDESMFRVQRETHGMLTFPAPSKLSGCTINREYDISGAGLGNGASELPRVPSNHRSKNVT